MGDKYSPASPPLEQQPRADSSGSSHQRSRVQLNEPHLPSGQTLFSMATGTDNNADLGNAAAAQSTSPLSEICRREQEQPQPSQTPTNAATRHMVFKPGSAMLHHVRHELEGLTRSELTAISDVLVELLASAQDDTMSHHGEQERSNASPILERIGQLVKETRSEPQNSRKELNEFAMNVVELKSELNHFKGELNHFKKLLTACSPT